LVVLTVLGPRCQYQGKSTVSGCSAVLKI